MTSTVTRCESGSGLSRSHMSGSPASFVTEESSFIIVEIARRLERFMRLIKIQEIAHHSPTWQLHVAQGCACTIFAVLHSCQKSRLTEKPVASYAPERINMSF
jgi:hypothetical protein